MIIMWGFKNHKNDKLPVIRKKVNVISPVKWRLISVKVLFKWIASLSMNYPRY